MEWHKLTKKTMPPDGVPIILWLYFGHCGFPVCGVCECEDIMYATYYDGIRILDRSDYRSTRWALIENPEEQND